MTDKLLPCPFCGGKAYTSENDGYAILCDGKKCHIEMGYHDEGNFYETEEEAITAWNNRSTLPPPDTQGALDACNRVLAFIHYARQNPQSFNAGLDFLDDVETALTRPSREASKCVTGCNYFDGGEVMHHKDCPYYPESLTKIYDDKDALNTKLLEALKQARDFIESPDLASATGRTLFNVNLSNVIAYAEAEGE